MRPADPARPAERTGPAVAQAKQALRERLRTSRQQPEHEATTTARTRRALELSAGHHCVALYCSIGTEPGTWPLIDALDARGVTVLLPLLGRRPDGSVRTTPDWGRFEGHDRMRVGWAGVPEPVTEALGAEGLRAATLIWCAGLAATPSGERLGTGGGWYDRALACAASDATVGVLLRDHEVLDAIPTQPFDRRVDVIVTEQRIVRTTGRAGPGAE